MAFAYCSPEEAGEVKPKVVVLDEHNHIAGGLDR
jgi:aspartate 1-decarboxylase